MKKDRAKKLQIVPVLLAVITMAVLIMAVASAVKEYQEKRAKERENVTKSAVLAEERSSSKDAVLHLESSAGGEKIPAGDREKMIRLTIVREDVPLFEIKKEPSENQTGFMEWYLTEPYSSKQLVNVSELYGFLDHYAAWDCIGEIEGEAFQSAGLYVEEEFEDAGVCRFEIGQQNKEGNYYVRADYSDKVYEVEKEQAEAMTELKPEDFMMGIASLVYLTTVEKLEIRTGECEAVFDIETAEDNSQIYKREGRVCGEKGFKEMYAALLSVFIVGEAGEIETEAAKEPMLSLHFYRNEKQLAEIEVNYYPYDDNYCLIERNGVKEFLAEREAVEQVITIVEKYCSR